MSWKFGDRNWVALEYVTQVVHPAASLGHRARSGGLGTSDKALRWINAPVRSLNNHTPASLLNTPEGIERVEDCTRPHRAWRLVGNRIPNWQRRHPANDGKGASQLIKR